MARDHTFVEADVVVPRPPTRGELARERWGSFPVAKQIDPVLIERGHDMHSLYVERFWLPVIGPTSICTARNLLRRVEDSIVDVVELAGEMGCKPDVMVRTLQRLERFGVLHHFGPGGVRVKTHLAPITLRQFGNLPEHLRLAHSFFVEEA